MSRPKVVVVGAGLTGLATAAHLADDHDVTVVEAGPPGGQIRTGHLAGGPFDLGADALLTRQPEGLALLRSLGFAGQELIRPTASRVLVRARGRLRTLPPRTVLGVPSDLVALARSGLISPSGVARAAAEPALPRRRWGADVSVGRLVGDRFGREVVDRVVDPLLGGVYAGDPWRLSAAATLGPVWETATSQRSLLAGLARRRRTVRGPAPTFVTVRGGLGRVVERLVERLGGGLLGQVAATGLDRVGERWRVRTAGGGLDADAVVLAVPAAVAGRLLAGVVPDAAAALGRQRTASVAVVALAYDPADAQGAPEASGVLVPRSEGGLVKAVTLSSRKWPHLASTEAFLVRASVGRVDDGRALDLDDATLVRRVDEEARALLGLRAPASERQVARWPAALPQYEVGHLEWVRGLERSLAGAPPGLHLGGASFEGVGLAARAADAARLAVRVRVDRRRGS